jgi:Fur family ferric uptake transcriptional regulator
LGPGACESGSGNRTGSIWWSDPGNWVIIGAHHTFSHHGAIVAVVNHCCMELHPMLQRQELRKAGLKVTLPRLKILEILESSEQRHLSAEDIYKELLDTGEDIGLATVYRVLTQFESAGLVSRHNFEGGHSVFEVDEGEHHDHMVCVETGDVVEFRNDEIERLQKEIARKHNYELIDHSLVLYVRPAKKKPD